MSSRLFISHASEDKATFVRPLAHALKKRGVNVWYDEFSLKPGDSLRRSIDKGLMECEIGIVVLSQSFFQKEWPQRELDALITAEAAGLKRIVPIWHNIDSKGVASFSLMLADKIALQSKHGPEAVAEQLISLLPKQSSFSGEQLALLIESFFSHETYVLECLRTGCQHRFLQVQAFITSYENLIDEHICHLDDGELDGQINEIIEQLAPTKEILLRTFGIPSDVEIVDGEAIPEERLSAWMSSFEEWVSGTQDTDEARSFVIDLDNYLDVDVLYVLFGLPNYSVSQKQRGLLEAAIHEIGTWVKQEDSHMIENLCEALRNSASEDGHEKL